MELELVHFYVTWLHLIHEPGTLPFDRIQAVDEREHCRLRYCATKTRNVAIYIHCEFGRTLDETLRMIGLYVIYVVKPRMQRRLLTGHALTYQKAMDNAEGMEAADSDARSLKTRKPPINKVLHRTSLGKEKKTCNRCGKTRHFQNQCHFKDALLPCLRQEREYFSSVQVCTQGEVFLNAVIVGRS